MLLFSQLEAFLKSGWEKKYAEVDHKVAIPIFWLTSLAEIRAIRDLWSFQV